MARSNIRELLTRTVGINW